MKETTLSTYTCDLCGVSFSNKKECEKHEKRCCLHQEIRTKFKYNNNYREAKSCSTCKYFSIIGVHEICYKLLERETHLSYKELHEEINNNNLTYLNLDTFKKQPMICDRYERNAK